MAEQRVDVVHALLVGEIGIGGAHVDYLQRLSDVLQRLVADVVIARLKT